MEMKAKLFKITCITNLHVGSGDANFDIVDKEVEKDPVTGLPVIHGSSIKGALSDLYEGSEKEYIFGKSGESSKPNEGGNYKFLDAKLLCRPLRAGGNNRHPYVLSTTVDAVNDCVNTARQFGIELPDKWKTVSDDVDFEGKKFLSDIPEVKIEGEKTGAVKNDTLKAILEDDFALASELDKVSLPIVARNNLGEKSRNLWYEEYVPHKSVFWTIILFPKSNEEFKLKELLKGIVQIGGNASVGNGYVKFEEIGANYEQAKGE